MEKITKGFEKFTIFCCILGAVAVVVLTMTTVIDVFLRTTIRGGFGGSVELVSALLTAVVYFGAGYCTLKQGMIVVDLFKIPRPIEIFHEILSIIMSLIIVYSTTGAAFFSMHTGVASLRLGIPKWPFMFITAFGFLVMAVALLINLINDEIDRKRLANALLEGQLEDSDEDVSAIEGGA
ncbi:MAG: TRAP transporter small permease [Clostridiales Family XIII bacterium]|nr:TRAP transporter small permease [Clostridiales Family XIII bacterium]